MCIDSTNVTLFADSECGLVEGCLGHTEDGSGCCGVHVQHRVWTGLLSSTAHPRGVPDMPGFPWACRVPWVFIMWKKKGKSCQSTSTLQVCQMTSAAEENLVSNHMQIGPKLLVMPWCQLWFLIHYLMGFSVYMPEKFPLHFLPSHSVLQGLFWLYLWKMCFEQQM